MIFVDYPGHLIAFSMGLICLAGLWLAFRVNSLKRLGIRRWALPLLPFAAMLVLLAVFFNPSSIQMAEHSRPCTVQVFFDTSRSMSIEDMGNKTRLDYATELFKKKFVSGDEGSPHYQIFGFDQQCYAADSLESLTARGEKSDLNNIWQRICAQAGQVQKQNHKTPVTGAIIFTDGQADSQHLGNYMAIRNKDFPVLLIPTGSTLKQPDVLIHSLDVPARIAVNTTYAAEVVVEAKRLKNRSVQIDLLQNDHVISTRSFTPKQTEEIETLNFEVSTSSTGLDKIEVIAKAADDELNTDNNRQIKMVNVVSNDRRRVLLYSQVAGFDIGKIRQSLQRDKKIELDFRLDAVINPAVTEKNPYLNKQVQLPTDADALNEFDILILGAMNYNALSDSQVQQLYHFVANRGGAIIFLAGKDKFALSKIRQDEICSLLPITFSNQPANVSFRANASIVSLTPEGNAMGLFADSQTDEKDWFVTEGYTQIRKKPAASTLFSFSQEPFVCVQRVGRGHVSFLNSFTLFQLYQSDEEGGPLQELLSELISHVSRISAGESRIDLSANINGDQDKVVFQACVRDSQYKPVDGATVLLDVSGQLTRMAPSSEGRYTATLENLKTQSVYAVAKAELGGNFLGEKTVVLNLPQKHDEMSRTEANKKFLEALAKQTRTSYLNSYDISEDTKKLFKAQQTLQQKAKPTPIWHNWGLVLIVCGLLTANWFMRRAMGLV